MLAQRLITVTISLPRGAGSRVATSYFVEAKIQVAAMQRNLDWFKQYLGTTGTAHD